MSDLDLDATKAAVDAHVAAGGTAAAAILLEVDPAALLDYAIEGRDLTLHAAARVTELLAEVERLKANQPDGGEWQYGIRWNYEKSKGIDWWSGTEQQLIAYVDKFDGKALAVKRWIGPVEPMVAGDE